MKAFTAPLSEYSEFVAVQTELEKKRLPVFVSGCIESQKCHLMYGLSEHYPFRLIVTYNEQRAKEICEDFKLYDAEVMYYPAKDIIFYNADIHGNAIVRSRMQVLKRLSERKPITVVVSLEAGMDRLLLQEVFTGHIVTVHEGDAMVQEEFLRTLVKLGYERQGQVEAPGDFAVRGGIIDLYPLTEETPFRIELWGDEIDTIRSFDVSNQRSIECTPSLSIYPATEFVLTEEQMSEGTARIRQECERTENALRKQDKIEEAARLRRTVAEFLENLEYIQSAVGLDSYVEYFYRETQSFFDYFTNEESIIFLDEPARLSEKGKAVLLEFTDSCQGRLEKGYILPKQANAVYDYKGLFGKLIRGNTVMLGTMEQKEALLPAKSKFALTVGGVSSYNNNFELLVKDLTKWKKAGYRVILLSPSRTRAARLAEDLREYELSAFYAEKPERALLSGEIMVTCGSLHRGFEYPLLKFTVISESDIFGTKAKKAKKRRHSYEGTKINGFSDLCAGDYVVHENHGLGVYRGIEKLEVDKATKDYIKIEYGDGGVLFLPATDLDVIQKYAGSDARKPKLNKLNSVEWKNTKARVRTAVRELANELVALYAIRQKKEGFRFERDTVWQSEFEEMFPFEETEDQLRAIEETKRDMESGRIMDRLVCGDVGYGKTEIALRAAFKAVQSGKQVAVLVPTTILAQQHYNTFSQRMKDFPVTIEMLSRFRSPAEQKKILVDTTKGRVDILIGTHRLLSKDLAFKNLGLLVVDEEQRFGVTHKERIKQLKNDIDVLTLTATPIPRTLHMSLVGIRDMSVLDEPPVDRLPIQTFVMEHNDEIIREAIERELSRGGQVYYVYNRVNGIDEVASRVAALVPEANVAFAHGQMQERTLERIMHDFINGDIDVLISTTIIETGLDISNVNTIIIDDADRLGLSQMYQLRGRVGRSSRTAYAFLMYKRDKMLKEIAEKRLTAIREFTELGSGFKIAMRDLEIRGAGNLLGEDQSGHMEAVGYDLYCKMLNEAVKHLKDDTPQEEGFETEVDIDVDAFIPSSYVKNEMQKLELYKRIALISNEEEYADMQEELTDRFGEIPNSVENLLRIALIKAQAHEVYVSKLEHKGAQVTFSLFPKAKLRVENIPEFLNSQEKRVRFVPGANPAFQYKLNSTAMTTPTASGKKKSPVEQLFDQVEAVLSGMKQTLLGIGLILLLSVSFGSLMTGCGVQGISFEEPMGEQEPTPSGTNGTDSAPEGFGETTLLTIDGQEIDYREALLLLLAAKEEAEILYGKGIWDITLDEAGTTYGTLRKEQVLEELIDTHIACLHAAELGVDIYEEENRDITEYTSEFIENVDRASLLQYNLTEALIKQIYRNNILAFKVYESITLSVDTDISDEEARQMKVQLIFKDKYKTDTDGNRELMEAEELNALREKTQELRDTASGKENFASFAELNTDAKDGVTKTIGAGVFPESMERIVLSLKDGELSPVLETEEGFYVVKCVKAFDEEATAAHKEAMILERQDTAFRETFRRWKEKTEIVINEEKLQSLQP